MIRINLDTKHFTLTIEGHARQEEGGEFNAVCTAVSAIAQGVAYCVTKENTEKDILEGMDYRPEPGDFLIRLLPTEWARVKVRKILNIYGDGLEMLAMSHPEFIRMERDGAIILAPEIPEETSEEDREHGETEH